MPRFRIFRSPESKWLSTAVDIARSLVSVTNCVPFPYVNTALSAGLVLLELFQRVRQSDEDLKYLSESVVAIMKLLREEVESHQTREHAVSQPFNSAVQRHRVDVAESVFIQVEYLNSQKIRDQISHFTRRVNDIRANATLVAATGTRMDLAGVESRISELIASRHSPRIDSEDDLNQSELASLEKDFHAFKLGDIYLDFGSARTNSFAKYANGSEESLEEKEMGWTDYRATVNGGVRTVRVYQGSSPTESWKDFLRFLSRNSPSAHLPQLQSLFTITHKIHTIEEEYRTLDEYGATLSPAQAIVDWELELLTDLAALHYNRISIVEHWQTRHSAMESFIGDNGSGTVAPDHTWAVVQLAFLGSAQALAYQGTPPRDCYPTADPEPKDGCMGRGISSPASSTLRVQLRAWSTDPAEASTASRKVPSSPSSSGWVGAQAERDEVVA
ncbi:hypothetical protein C8R47DRAFT_1277349 [Mycena vitilis]|nr:hypothetical protein C8R47DRAFT_1277349 [Mycena vitilis]